MDNTRNVVCVKWGELYGAEYVNRLCAMVARHTTPPLRLVCLTDRREGICPEVECLDLPELGCAHPVGTRGKWRKQILWGREVPRLRGVALFIDLDSVIVGSLDDCFSWGSPQEVILARNWALPFRKQGQTSVFRDPVGANPHILEDFRADPQGIADKYQFEQHGVTAAAKGGIKFWPEDWTRHFRLHCLPKFPLNYFKVAALPPRSRIVTFPGRPKPDDVIRGRWNKRVAPHLSRWAHVRATFGPDRVDDSRWRHLRCHVLPVPWIEAHWHDQT